MFSSLEGKTGMIAPKQSRQMQRVVIEFLLSEGETAQNRSRRLKQVYGDIAIDYSTVTRWVKRINDGQEEPAESDVCNRPRNGRPSSAHSSANIDQAGALIKENRRITINELAKSLRVSAGKFLRLRSRNSVWKVLQYRFENISENLGNRQWAQVGHPCYRLIRETSDNEDDHLTMK